MNTEAARASDRRRASPLPGTSLARDVRLALPKGRMQTDLFRLLEDAGVRVRTSERDYRPAISLDGFHAKILKPRNVISMLAAGARDIGFAGADWVAETGCELVELLDTGLDPVQLVAAAPITLMDGDRLPRRRLVVASEYPNLATRWIRDNALDASVLTTYGATEVFPPEDADVIIDNTATGATLRANGLMIVDDIMHSSTRLYAAPAALDDPTRAASIDAFVLLVRSVLEARRRVMVDLNVAAENLEPVIACLPCMREPSIARLHGDTWFSVRAAVPRPELARIIPALKAAGARDIITTAPDQIIP